MNENLEDFQNHIMTPRSPKEFFEIKDSLDMSKRGIEEGQLSIIEEPRGIYAVMSRKGQAKQKLLLLQFFTKSLSEETRKTYQRELLFFFNFLFEKNFPTDEREILNIHYIAYRDYLIKNGYANKTTLRKLSIITSYFEYLVDNDVLDKNHCKLRTREKPLDNVYVRPTNALNDDEVLKVLDIAKNYHPNIYQRKFHFAVLAMLLSTGLRKSELINLKKINLCKIDDIDFLRVVGKGGKQREVPLVESAKNALFVYLESMIEQGREVKEADFIFQPQINNDPKDNLCRKVSKTMIEDICSLYVNLAGIKKRISPHSMRATTITHLKEQGADIFGIAQFAGHSSVETTKKYIKRTEQLKNSVVFKLKF